jgi:2-polyprenyl-3-methyl-5-hydroxy-6-metoxy-1,4-benzoquinol methylase
MDKEKNLTNHRFWEDYWNKQSINKSKKKTTLLIQEIFRIFDKYLPKDSSLNVLEIGGGSGEFLLYMAKNFGYNANSMDYSSAGNEKTKETFVNNGIDIIIYEQDLFTFNDNSLKFDIVFSLGFIEHFDNVEKVIEKHLELLKPGGILLLGVPNLAGIYHEFLKYLSPSHDKTHNLKTMDIDNWKVFEKKGELITIFKGYIGGFEPLIMKKLDLNNYFNQFLYFIVKLLMIVFSFRMSFLRKINSKYWSGYMIGIYRKPL